MNEANKLILQVRERSERVHYQNKCAFFQQGISNFTELSLRPLVLNLKYKFHLKFLHKIFPLNKFTLLGRVWFMSLGCLQSHKERRAPRRRAAWMAGQFKVGLSLLAISGQFTLHLHFIMRPPEKRPHFDFNSHIVNS